MNPYEILKSNQTYAVIGINQNPEKYAHRIYELLKQKGKTVYGVHPSLESVDGDKVYTSIMSLPTKPDVVVFVVRPVYGMEYLESIASQGISTIWLQPGTISDELVTKASVLGLEVIEDCVLRQYAINEK